MNIEMTASNMHGASNKVKQRTKLRLSHLAIAVGQCLAVATTQAATMRVNTALDNVGVSTCSLRDAMDSINDGGNRGGCVNSSNNGFGVDDVIEFSTLFNNPRTINLTLGELEITRSVRINGPGEERLTIDAGRDSRAIFINGVEQGDAAVDNVNINNLTVSNGSASTNAPVFGGGIYANRVDSLMFSDITISQNTAPGGAGITVSFAEELTIDNATIMGNTAAAFGAGIFIFVSSNEDAQTISNSLISDNIALGTSEDGGGGGGILLRYTDGLQLNGNQILNNSAGVVGGGVFLSDSSGTSISNSTITGNSVVFPDNSINRDGGGIGIVQGSNTEIVDSVVSNNVSMDRGGGISVNGSSVTFITRTRVEGNSTGFSGGGIYAMATPIVNIDSSSISGNSSNLNGGGVTLRGGGDNHRIGSSTLSGNRSNQLGGGLHAYSADLSVDIVNNTFSGNSTVFEGGGMYIGQGATAYLFSNTITGNTANVGAGIFRDDQATNLNLSRNNVIANSRRGTDCGNRDRGPITATASDWIEDGSCSRAADGDPRLGPLSDNGGFSRTHAPEPGSGLIGSGLTCETVDQRGVSRPLNGCIIGSVEEVINSGSIFVVPLPDGSVVTFEL